MILPSTGRIGAVPKRTKLFGRYHGLIRELTSRDLRDEAWRPDLRQILQWFDDDCRQLSAPASDLLRRELASQIEHEALRFSDPAKRAVLIIALKHLDAVS